MPFELCRVTGDCQRRSLAVDLATRLGDPHVYLMRCDCDSSNRGHAWGNNTPRTLYFFLGLRPNDDQHPRHSCCLVCVFILDGQREHEHPATGAGRQERTSSRRPGRLDQEPRPTCQDGRTQVSLYPSRARASLALGLATYCAHHRPTHAHTRNIRWWAENDRAGPRHRWDVGPPRAMLDSQSSPYSYSVAKLTALVATL